MKGVSVGDGVLLAELVPVALVLVGVVEDEGELVVIVEFEPVPPSSGVAGSLRRFKRHCCAARADWKGCKSDRSKKRAGFESMYVMQMDVETKEAGRSNLLVNTRPLVTTCQINFVTHSPIFKASLSIIGQ